MKQRGRKSPEALALQSINPLEIVQRPDAPYDLTDEQVEEWRAIVSSLPADWFQRGNHPLLSQLCRHLIAARRIAQLIEQSAAGKEIDHKDFLGLLRQQESESRAINALLRSMRLTQIAIMRHETAKRPVKVKKPWDPD